MITTPFLILFLCGLFQIQALSVSKHTYQQLFNEQLLEALQATHHQRSFQRLFPGLLKEYGTIRRTDWNKPKELGLDFGRDYIQTFRL